MPEIRAETTIQVIVDDRRNWVKISQFDYLFTIELLGQDMFGETAFAEGLTLEEAMNNFAIRWEQWNECGPY